MPTETTEEPSKALVLAPAFQIDEKTADDLNGAFAPIHAEASKWIEAAKSINITDASQIREMKLAREYRLALRDVRISAERKHKELKEGILRRGKAIDGVKNIILDIIGPSEAHLMEQEKFAERLEAKRQADLKDHREALLTPLGVNVAFYKLGEMPDDQFEELYAGQKAAHEAKIAAAKKAEEDRLAKIKADAEEREKQRAENERLRAEAAAREEQAKKDRQAAEDERQRLLKAAADEKARMEAIQANELRERALEESKIRAEAAAKLKAAEEKALKEREAAAEKARKEKQAAELIVSKERAAREKAEQELAAKRIAEEAEAEKKRAAEENAAKAPDRDKLVALARFMRGISTPVLSTAQGAKTALEIGEKINQFADWIEKKAGTM